MAITNRTNPQCSPGSTRGEFSGDPIAGRRSSIMSTCSPTSSPARRVDGARNDERDSRGRGRSRRERGDVAIN